MQKVIRISWDRYCCPSCSYVWERNNDGAWRYVSQIAVPIPDERSCPPCGMMLPWVWIEPLPLFPHDQVVI